MSCTLVASPARHALDPSFISRHGLHGMVPGSPGGVEGDTAAIDRAIAEEACPHCATPREFHPFIHGTYGTRRHRGGSYRAFSICPGCGLEEEF